MKHGSATVAYSDPLPRRGRHQLLVVQMTFAEIPADEWPGDGFAFPHHVVRFIVQSTSQQSVERAAVDMHAWIETLALHR